MRYGMTINSIACDEILLLQKYLPLRRIDTLHESQIPRLDQQRLLVI